MRTKIRAPEATTMRHSWTHSIHCSGYGASGDEDDDDASQVRFTPLFGRLRRGRCLTASTRETSGETMIHEIESLPVLALHARRIFHGENRESYDKES
jgi:hypothetical protein